MIKKNPEIELSDKPDLLTKLPIDIKILVARKFLPIQDLARLARTNQENQQLFQPLVSAHKFVSYLVNGKIDEAQNMLKKDSSLLFKKVEVTDCSGRTFFYISGFQYALWALDKDMWEILLNCLAIKDETIWLRLLTQYNQVEKKGVRYRIADVEIKENHYDFEIVNALKKHMDFFGVPIENITNWDEMKRQWQQEVGGAQLKLPMHVVYEYCSDNSDSNDFLQQTGMCQKYRDRNKNSYEDWFSSTRQSEDKKLGVHFAICQGADIEAFLYEGPTVFAWKYLELDLIKMQNLQKQRIIDFANLKHYLVEQLKNSEELSSISPLP